MYIGDSKRGKKTFYWQHLLAWVAGILCAMVPFVGFWEIGTMKIPMRFGSGNFGFNILIATGLCMLGGVIGGYWWRFCKWLIGGKDYLLTTLSLILLALGVTGLMSKSLHGLFFYLISGVVILGVICALVYRDKASREGLIFVDFIYWLRTPSQLNGVFYILLFLVMGLSNTLLLLELDVTVREKGSAIIGRWLMSLAVVGVLYLLCELTMRAAPKYFRWIPWLALSMAPLVVIGDQWMGVALGRRFIEFVNSLTSSGSFDPAVELAASGVDVGPMGAKLLMAGVLGCGLTLAWGAWIFSKYLKMKLSMGVALTVALVSWAGGVIEQGIGAHWKSKAAWQAEHKLFDLNIGVFSPPRGVGQYTVSFYPPQLGLESAAVSAAAVHPDIHIIMVESLRADALSKKTSPYLWKMMEAECQQLGRTWSSSNATHLSWYGFFHSQVPVFWRDTLEAISERDTYLGSPALQWMKKSGYDLQVRAVCDLGYKDFGLLNFGGGLSLVDVWQDTQRGVDFDNNQISGREVITFRNLRKAVMERSEGGAFFFTALDSPHYNYYWHDSYTPPYDDYEENIQFPFNPSEEEIMRYKRRYWNSVAWVDHQVGEFCEFLKKEGRYENSVIIITGDHGEEFQEQGSWCHCSSLEPEQIEVPLLIKWPAAMGRGPAHAEASHLDVMPTLLDMLAAPSEVNGKMVGRSLLGKLESHTQIAATAYAGQTGETMILRRDGYQANFSWSNYWDARVPEDVVLERITDPGGLTIILDSPEAYAAELRRLFPDAFTRFFSKFEVIKN